MREAMGRASTLALVFVLTAGGATALSFAGLARFVREATAPVGPGVDLHAELNGADGSPHGARPDSEPRVEVSIEPDLVQRAYPPEQASFIPFMDIRESTRERFRAESRSGELGGLGGILTVTELTLERQADGSITGSLGHQSFGGCLQRMEIEGEAAPVGLSRVSARIVLSSDWFEAKDEFLCAAYILDSPDAEPPAHPFWFRVKP